MLANELITLVEDIRTKKCERQNIELKRAALGTPEKLYDTLSSFANQTGGGIIVFGIDEKADYQITGVYDSQDLQTKVTNQALQMEPVVRPVFTIAQINGKTVVSAEIAECDIFSRPCFYKGAGRVRGSYIRVGEADMPMTEYEVYSYEALKKQLHDELRVAERAGLEDFASLRLNEYFVNVRRYKPNLAKLEEKRILQLQGMAAENKPTIAGLMVLGEYPQAFFPQLSITAIAIAGYQFGDLGRNNERFMDNQRLEGNLIEMLEGAMAFIRRNIKCATIINGQGKREDKNEYPLVAVREIILNALIHRDYSMHTDHSPIRILIYKDRLEVENPGGLYGRITLNDLGKIAADTRNPFIATAMEALKATENRFSGIPIIRAEMEKAGLPPPQFFNSRGVFKVVLYNGQGRQEPLPNYSVYEHGVPYGKPAKTDEPKPFEPVEAILAFCREPRSRTEIAQLLQLDTPAYVVKKYLRPLVEAKKLRLTVPEAPKSKNQKYVTV